ncbi:hypothetical protein AVEN_157595-1 [Araneus ventricosus]|uniref:Uncharacterized protein n=1 Tax=Araneus ventricosus TaxID=182803 RepID=A0A4Y2KB59_ARAVE|nr:hypothetical protein AVEN_157595-1 [Araneus ventricosus]
MESKWSDACWEVSDHREEEPELSLRSLVNYRSAPYTGQQVLLIVNKDGRFSKHDEENTQFRANQSKHGNPSGHNDQLGVVKDVPIDAYSGIGFYAARTLLAYYPAALHI